MLCKDIMKKDFAFLREDDSIQSAAQTMKDLNIGFLPVCDPQSEKPIGTLTDRDIAVRVAASGKSASETRVSEVMSATVYSCSEDDDLDRCRELMADHHVSRMLITSSDGRLCGVISLSDLPQVDEEAASETFSRVTEREVQTH